MKEKNNYVKYYEEYYGIIIPDGFVIHHIDLDHNNNHIDNLIMLPNKLHAKYHMCVRQFKNIPIEINRDNIQNHWALTKLGEVMKECKKYFELKTNWEIAKESRNIL
jgi:hypothetical protein